MEIIEQGFAGRTPLLDTPNGACGQPTSGRISGWQTTEAVRLAWVALLAVGMASFACDSGSSGSGDTSNSSGVGGMTDRSGAAGSGGTADASGASGGSGGAAGTNGGTDPTGAAASAYEVKVDPYGVSPLVAVVNLPGIEASEVQGVQVVVAGQDGGQDFERTYSPTDVDLANQLDSSDLTFAEPGYHVPVLGLYADRENEVRIHVDLANGEGVDSTLLIATRLVKPGEDPWVPTIHVRTALSELMEPGWTVAEISIEP
ncbi:MAG: arylsulfate sulfotransferase N-terminal domain-containing protein, partial [Polyangiaceae bacterium]|nr:arylsulfate sulfotransferase N-terminal domain-containing protein [Polyangiaceae bacterium]